MDQFLRSMLALAFGCYFGYTMKAHEVPRVDQVRRALYVACAGSRSFDPSERQVGSCNRLSIENTLVAAYGGNAVMPPSTPTDTARYESPLVELHQNMTR